jgi:arylformamidase
VEIFDISQTLREGMTIWPGDPEFHRNPVSRIENGDSANVSAIYMGTHSGTHIDAPLHIDDSGKDAASVSISPFIGRARVIAISAGRSVRTADLASLEWQGVERVLFKTFSGIPPENEFDPNFVYLKEDACEFLAGQKILLVGTDAPSVDPYDSTDLPSHKILIRNGTAILEGIRLGAVPPGDYNLVCLPLKLAGADGSPVRAVLWKP